MMYEYPTEFLISYLERSLFNDIHYALPETAIELREEFIKLIISKPDLSKVFPEFYYWQLTDTKWGLIKEVKGHPKKWLKKLASFYLSFLQDKPVSEAQWKKSEHEAYVFYQSTLPKEYISGVYSINIPSREACIAYEAYSDIRGEVAAKTLAGPLGKRVAEVSTIQYKKLLKIIRLKKKEGKYYS